MFRQQLRAILRASAYGRVRILIPMVAHLSEVKMTLEALGRARRQLDDAGHAYTHVEIGAMIEVPAAALSLVQFLRHFDFVSIGTNDLIQYTLAIDRADDAVSHLYDPWHPAVIGLIADVIARANAAGKGVSVCGEMAGDPEFTELLLAMGLRSFSMHPAQIPSIKQRVLRADTRRLSVALGRVLAADDPQREVVHAFLCTRRSRGTSLQDSKTVLESWAALEGVARLRATNRPPGRLSKTQRKIDKPMKASHNSISLSLTRFSRQGKRSLTTYSR